MKTTEIIIKIKHPEELDEEEIFDAIKESVDEALVMDNLMGKVILEGIHIVHY